MNLSPLQPIIVTPAESGQKLLQFLRRRFAVPPALLHRLIRSGQVRVNMKRAKAFDRVQTGDAVRMPPTDPAKEVSAGNFAHTPLPLLVAEHADFFVFNKPAGLPVQPGSGHADCLVSRLKTHFTGADFMPTPAHRLDKFTTGLIIVARTYAALRRLQAAFAARDRLRKEYFAWAQGECPGNETLLFEDILTKGKNAGKERMLAQKENMAGQKAALGVRKLRQQDGCCLLHIMLHTGRTHQIRAQLAARGLPVVGDPKYGGPKNPQGMLLHAARLTLLEETGSQCYEVLPPWTGVWRVDQIPAWQ